MLAQCANTSHSAITTLSREPSVLTPARTPGFACNSPPLEIQHIKPPKNPPTTYALDIMQRSRSSPETRSMLCRAYEGILRVIVGLESDCWIPFTKINTCVTICTCSAGLTLALLLHQHSFAMLTPLLRGEQPSSWSSWLASSRPE